MTRSIRTILLLTASTAALSQAQPTIGGVTNGASYSGNLAPGTWASIFGTQLASDISTASSIPLSNQLNGVSVTFGGFAAPMRYVSPAQLNVIIPFELSVPAAGTPVPVVVTTSAGSSTPFNVWLSRNSPGLFTQDASISGPAWVFDANFNPVGAIGNDPIILYAAGLGPTNPPASSASGGASTEPLNRIQDNLSVFIGDQQADILFAGLAPGFPGIYQLNVVPRGAITGRAYLKINGWQSNITSVPVTPGSNVENVTGSIDGLYPSTLPQLLGGAPTSGPIFASVMLMAARFTTSFDILPNAKPFSVVATSEGGTAVMNIDPVQSTWQANFTVPMPAARNGDFSLSEFTPVLDFSTCRAAGCSPFPNSVIPLARFDPVLVKAQSLIPLPTLAPIRSANGVYSTSGTLVGTHFDTSAIAIAGFGSFGGYIQIPYAGAANRTTTIRLYVDGQMITSKDVTCPVL